MNVKYFYSFLAVGALALIAWVGCDILGLQVLFGVILPYLAVVVFFVGFFIRMMDALDGTLPNSHDDRPGQVYAVD